MTVSPATTVIYSISFLSFIFWAVISWSTKVVTAANTLPVLGTGVKSSFVYTMYMLIYIRDWCKIKFCLCNVCVNCEFEMNTHYYQSNVNK